MLVPQWDYCKFAPVLSPVEPRSWGADVGYSLDPDGQVLAFARDS